MCWYNGYEFSVCTCFIGWVDCDELLSAFLMVFSWRMDYTVDDFVNFSVHVLLILVVLFCGCCHKAVVSFDV